MEIYVLVDAWPAIWFAVALLAVTLIAEKHRKSHHLLGGLVAILSVVWIVIPILYLENEGVLPLYMLCSYGAGALSIISMLVLIARREWASILHVRLAQVAATLAVLGALIAVMSATREVILNI